MDSDVRQIGGIMIAAVVFSTIGAEFASKQKQKQSKVIAPVTIVLGGSIAAVLLIALADFAPASASFAKGLALTALLTSIVINGAPVFSGINQVVSGPKTATTTPTQATPGGK